MHIVYRFDTGGLENGVVNLINHMPSSTYRHAVVALTEATDFRHRIVRGDVSVTALHKPPGHGLRLYPKLWRIFRAQRPAIVHSRNLAALEAVVPACASGVPVRIHGEHGRDVDDLHGERRKYRWLRRAYRPFVSQYVALSDELADYLVADVGIAAARVNRIVNGVDTMRFTPADAASTPIDSCPFDGNRHWLVGTVGRMKTVKNQTALAHAFVRALVLEPALRERLRLVMFGDGPLRAQVQAILQAAGVADLAWLPGERDDVAKLMRGLNCFVLPSLAEGVSNTILEAMASGLPVIATDVGANAELVESGRTGEIVPSADADVLAASLLRLASQPAQARAMGAAGRERVQECFSLQAMVVAYTGLYDTQLARAGIPRRRS